jgi:hypothetical protein
VQGLHGERHQQAENDTDPERAGQQHHGHERKREKHAERDATAIAGAIHAEIHAICGRIDDVSGHPSLAGLEGTTKAAPFCDGVAMFKIHTNPAYVQ